MIYFRFRIGLFILVIFLFLVGIFYSPRSVYAEFCCSCAVVGGISRCVWAECPDCEGSGGGCTGAGSCSDCSVCGGGGCFTGDTPVRMGDDSEKPIEEVEVGEVVKSFNSQTGEITESEVTEVYEHSKEEVKGYYILTTESGKQVKVTPEHPILAMKTSETMNPLELSLLKAKAAFLSAARKLQGILF